MESITGTATATATAGVIKSAHAEVVASASVELVEAAVYYIPTLQIPVACYSEPTLQPKISTGFFYHFEFAPGLYSGNSSCMNAGDVVCRRHLVVLGEVN